MGNLVLMVIPPSAKGELVSERKARPHAQQIGNVVLIVQSTKQLNDLDGTEKRKTK